MFALLFPSPTVDFFSDVPRSSGSCEFAGCETPAARSLDSDALISSFDSGIAGMTGCADETGCSIRALVALPAPSDPADSSKVSCDTCLATCLDAPELSITRGSSGSAEF